MRGVWSTAGDYRKLNNLVIEARVGRVELRDIQIVSFLNLLRPSPQRANIGSQYPVWLLSQIIDCLVSVVKVAIILRGVEVGQRVHVESLPRKVFPVELLNYYGSTMKGDQHVSLRDSNLLASLLPMDHILDVRSVLVSKNLYFRFKLLQSGAGIIAVTTLVAPSKASDQVSTVQVVPLMI